jgi:hypothetical protein
MTTQPSDLLLAYNPDFTTFSSNSMPMPLEIADQVATPGATTGGANDDADGYYTDFNTRLEEFVRSYPRLGGGDAPGIDWSAVVIEGGYGSSDDDSTSDSTSDDTSDDTSEDTSDDTSSDSSEENLMEGITIEFTPNSDDIMQTVVSVNSRAAVGGVEPRRLHIVDIVGSRLVDEKNVEDAPAVPDAIEAPEASEATEVSEAPEASADITADIVAAAAVTTEATCARCL